MAITINHRGGTIVLSGEIEEDFDPRSVQEACNTRKLTINLEGIRRINSRGVARWVPMVTRLVREFEVSFVSISYAMAAQARSVANFFGGPSVNLISCIA